MSSIFDPGRADRNTAAGQAQQGIITGGQATGPGGISAGFNFSGGQGSINSSLGSFAPLLAQLQGLAGQGFQQAGGGLPPELMALMGGTIDRLGQQDISQLTNQQDFAGLGDVFQSSLATAQADPFELGSGISAKLRQLSERRNSRLVNRTFDRLKASGNLGSSAGLERAGNVERGIFEQGLNFDLAGLQAGQGIQRDAFGRLMAASQGREAIGGRQFGESFAIENLGGQRALQQFGVGSQGFQQFLQNQMQGFNIGAGATGAGANLSQLPLSFLAALQGTTGQASNTQFAAAGINQNNASLAQSPFLQALNAAGGFASGFGAIGA